MEIKFDRYIEVPGVFTGETPMAVTVDVTYDSATDNYAIFGGYAAQIESVRFLGEEVSSFITTDLRDSLLEEAIEIFAEVRHEIAKAGQSKYRHIEVTA